MLTEKQINEVKTHLEKAQNPVFYYDNDSDGLCSFLILRRFIGRGKGVAVRSFPELNEGYARRARELNADYVFILDKPVISREFVEEIDKMQIPIVWIDHHKPNDIGNEIIKSFRNFYVYNPVLNKGKNKSDEPVTYLCYKIANRKEDIWLGVIGCIADHFLPDFTEEFAERYPDYWGKNIKKPFDAYYRTEIGRIARAFNFGLKDSISNVVAMQRFLISAKGPEEVFSETNSNSAFRKKYAKIKEKYDSLIEKAKNDVGEKIIYFEYSGETSMSSDISNELSYFYPEKYIVIAFKKGGISNLSMRGKKVRDVLEKVLKKFENSSGGGHENAVGARVRTEDLKSFKRALEEEIHGK